MLYQFTSQAGIIEEMLEDTFESMEDGEEMEEEAEEEVDKILFEITAGEETFKLSQGLEIDSYTTS